MSGGELAAQVLKNNGITHLFTLCGGHISPILVEAKALGIRIVDVRHEVNAAFCADAYARMTGRPGVAAVTAGPGVANTLTAIKNAQLAQSPLVLIGGATATLLRGRGSLQDIDQMTMIQDHVKWSARPNRVSEIIPTLERAFQEALNGVPGPVFVELAVDLLYPEGIVRDWTGSKTDRENPNLSEKLQAWYINRHLNRVFKPGREELSPAAQRQYPTPSKSLIAKAGKWLSGARKPVLILGSQCMLDPAASKELVASIEKLNCPVFLSGMARGLLGKDHPLQLRHKRRLALKEADVVLLAGAPCDFRLDYGAHVRKARVISINLSSKDLYKNRRPDLPLLGDPHRVLCAIAETGGAPVRSEWLATLRERASARDLEINDMASQKTEGINPMLLCQEVEKRLSENSVLVGDGGDFVATASYILSPRGPYGWLDPGVFGTLGVGAGFAIGAKLMRPDSDVWLLYGDGAAGFSIMEFDTCARLGIPIIAVVGNDSGWTQIARDQVVLLKDDVATRLAPMDYQGVAEACGGVGIRISRQEEIGPALERALAESRAGKPVLINAIIGKTDFRKGSISI